MDKARTTSVAFFFLAFTSPVGARPHSHRNYKLLRRSNNHTKAQTWIPASAGMTDIIKFKLNRLLSLSTIGCANRTFYTNLRY